MKLAYLILCHKNAHQVKRLVNRLNSTENIFVLHISQTCDKGFDKEIIHALQSYPNVHFCRREDSTHNSFGVIKAIISGLKLLSNYEFDYVNLISGQDYPIKSQEKINAFFKENNGKEFLEYFSLHPEKDSPLHGNHPWGPHRQLYRIDRYHLKFSGAVHSIPELGTGRLINKPLIQTLKIFLYESPQYISQKKWLKEFQLLLYSRILPRRRRLPDGLNVYGGKTWWSLSADCVKYILHRYEEDSVLKKFFKYTLIPDEMFFQTLLLDSPFRDKCVNNCLRLIRWEKEDGLHPIILTAEHEDLIASSEDLFARKFDEIHNAEILNWIDEKLI